MKMNFIKSSLIMGFALSSVLVAAQGISTPYSPGVTQDAISYWLPKTKLTVKVTTTKRSFKPGEFSRYAERYLRMSQVKNKAEDVWEITDISVMTSGVPDKDNLYTLAFPAKGNRPYFELTNDGILAAVNTHIQEESTGSQEPTAQTGTQAKVNPQDYMTEEILMAGSTAKMAELTAKEIYNIRESRNAITRGQADYVPTDGESLKYMLESLSQQEAALLTLFSGTNESEEHVFMIEVNPDESLSKQVLFRFSLKLGVLPIDNLAGEPVWIDVKDYNMPGGQASESKAKTSKKGQGPFLYYRIPGRALVKVYNNRKSFLEQDVQIAQFGNVEVVSSSIMGKHSDTKIVFDTTTGNVKSINE